MTGVDERSTPQNDLETVQERVEEDGFEASMRVLRGLGRFDCTRDDVADCLQSLTLDDFHKSQRHERHDDIWLDIYKPHWDGVDWYVKFFLGRNGKVQALSFKWAGAI